MGAGAGMLTERDLIMRLVRQLAEVLAAALRLRREGKREEALVQIDQVTGRLTGMDAGALCLFGGPALAGVPPELRLPLARLLRARAHLLREAGDLRGFHQALRAARTLVQDVTRSPLAPPEHSAGLFDLAGSPCNVPGTMRDLLAAVVLCAGRAPG